MTPAKVAGTYEISGRKIKMMSRDSLSESSKTRLTPTSEKKFTTRLVGTLLQYAVFALVGMITVLAVMWKQTQPTDVSILQNTLVSILSDVLMVPALIIIMAICKALLVWVSDHWRYETLDQRLASHRKLQNDLLLSGLSAFATWLTFLTTGGDQHHGRHRAAR